MKFSQVLLLFICLLITLCTAIHAAENTTFELERIVRRPCTCKTSTGRCMNIGARQCWFGGKDGASIVECNKKGEWKMAIKCENTCQTLQDDRAHCLVPVDQIPSAVDQDDDLSL